MKKLNSKMKTKVLKIYIKTWNKLRRQISGRKNETMADYMDRVLLDPIHSRQTIKPFRLIIK